MEQRVLYMPYRIMHSLLVSLVSSCAFVVFNAQASIDFDAVHLETEQVAGNVSMIKLVGAHASNIGVVVSDEAILIVDSQYAELTENIQAEIDKLSALPILYLANTHYHPDHTGGNENFANAGTTIIAHENVARVMSVDRKSIATGKVNPAAAEQARPSITYTDSLEIKLNKETVRILHVANSHTSGDSFVHFVDSNVLQMGDTYRTTTYPIVDISDGGSYLGIIKIMERAIKMSNARTKIIPGHGHISDIRDLKSLCGMMITIRNRIHKMILNGDTLEQVIAAKPTADFDERWAFAEGHFMSLDKMLGLFYQELSAK